jgi:class 3 adenylate cyclase/tetratricopeptide (TPR) repeat protein
MRCGAPLGARGVGDERKVVTVLFCDLVGFTSWAERLDPEEVHATLRTYHAEVMRRIERHGGTVEKFIGDAVLGLFGVPAAHEDDPERAVRAALRILDGLAALNDRHGLDLHVRIGVNTGEAIVATTSGDQVGGTVAGDVVNTGARLQTAAPVDGVLVGESTYRATAAAFTYEEHPAIDAKGKAEPVPAWRAIRARSRIGVDLRDRPATQFVGRTAERTLLRQVFHLATRAKDPASPTRPIPVVLVTGEAGVGKSRLVLEFSRYLDEIPELVRWRGGRCLPYGEGVRFWALGEIVKAEAGILDTDRPNETQRKLEEALTALRIEEDQRAWMGAMLGTLLGLPGPEQTPPRHEIFAAWRAFLEALALDGPTVLVIEDLQWADEALIAFLTSLAMRAVDVPLLLICVARPELADRYPDWEAPLPNLTRIALPPLDEQESRGLLAALLDGTQLPPQTEAALLARSGGNPLFAEEFIRMLRDRGPLGPTAAGIAEIPVPRTLESLVAARLDALPVELKTLIQDAAVLGKTFWPGALAAVGDADRDVVQAELPFLLRRELVHKLDESSIVDEPEFAFRHDVIREVAYRQIPKRARADKHRNAAAWIRTTAGERAADLAEEVAHHLTTALELTRDADANLRAESAQATFLAAERVAPLDAAAAAVYYRRALDLLDQGDPLRVRALAHAAGLAGSMGRFADEDTWYREAIAGSREAGDELRAGELMGRLARSLVRHGRLAEADELFDEAVHTLERFPPGPELARVYSHLAGQRFVAGDFDESLRWAERALEIVDGEEPADAVVLALQYRGSGRAEHGDPGGLEDIRAAIRLAKRANLTDEAGTGMTNLAYLLWMREGPAASLELALEAESFAAQRGFVHSVMWAKVAQAEALFDLGHWDRVLTVADEMIEWDSPEGYVTSQVGMWARWAKAWVLARRGELRAATVLVEEVEQHAQLMEYAEFRATALSIGAWIAWASGDLELARARLDQYAKVTTETPEIRIHFLPIAARILVGCGDLAAAEALVPPLSGTVATRRRLSIETTEAVLTEARGDLERAADTYGSVANGWEAFGFVLERGQCLLGRGRCLLGLGRTDQAWPPLTAAREALRPMGVRSVLAEIDELLGA